MNDSFIDNEELEEHESQQEEVLDFFKSMKTKKELQKKHEPKGDIEVADLETIEREEENTRRIGKREDYEAMLYNKEHGDDEDDEDDEEDY